MTLSATKDGESSWQVKSENLHSGSDTVVTQQAPGDVTGNQRVASTHESTNPPNTDHVTLPNPDLLNDVDCALPRKRDFSANDNCEKVARGDTTAEAGRIVQSKQGSLNRPNSSGSGRRSFNYPLPPPPPPPEGTAKEENPPLKEAEEDDLPPPPPLPPKISSPLPETPVSSYTYEKSNLDVPREGRPFEKRLKSHTDISELQEQSTVSTSEISIPGLAGSEPRTRSQYEMLGQKMIEEGFYSVPSKPPIPPEEQEDFDTIQQALDELDRAARSLTRNSLDNSDSRSSDCVFESGKPLRFSGNRLNQLDQHLLAPIPMTFDERRPVPDYGSTDALSTFAIELEASFDRIQQSMSSDHLDERPAASPLERPFGKSAGTLPVQNQRASTTSRASRNARVGRMNSKNGEGRFHFRKESGEVIDL